jgi:hypothetical protein
MTSFLSKLYIMTLLMNALAATAFMRGSSSRHRSNVDAADDIGLVKARTLVAIAAGRQRLLLDEADSNVMNRLVHDSSLLGHVGSAALMPRSDGGSSMFDDSKQMTDCEEMQVAALQAHVTSPQVITSDTTGEDSFYFEVFAPSNGTALGIFLDIPSSNITVDGVCYKSGGWSFYNWHEDDMIFTYAPCDGSEFTYSDGTASFDQLILSGTGKYECAKGYVDSAASTGDLVTFDIAFCMDPSVCV